MDNSSSFSSQPRSFLFLLEPIRASTEKAWARELRAAADRLLSLISHKSTRRGVGRSEKPTPSVQRGETNQQQKKERKKKTAHVSIYCRTQTHRVSKVIPTVTRNAASKFRGRIESCRLRLKEAGRRIAQMRSVALRVSPSFYSDFLFSLSVPPETPV